MGNSFGKIGHCFAGAGEISSRHDIAVILSDPFHEGLGHSFCYIRPEPARLPSSTSTRIFSELEDAATTTFRTISGASVSANASTPLSTSLADLYPYSTTFDRAAAFDCSNSFASIPLQPVPRHSFSGYSGGMIPGSGPLDNRGFLSGPFERGFASGPIDRGSYSGPIEKGAFEKSDKLQRSLTNKPKPKKRSLIRNLKGAISRTLTLGNKPIVLSNEPDSEHVDVQNSVNLNSHVSFAENEELGLQWAQGKAGEDRIHVVISEENGWVFVGIYDGFNGPDAPDYLLANLYSSVHRELKDKLWNDKSYSTATTSSTNSSNSNSTVESDRTLVRKGSEKIWKCEWERGSSSLSNSEVLNALSRALAQTEEAYLESADKMVMDNPELALMGSCVLVMLMKGEDVYLMNVGDSRAILAQQLEPDYGLGKPYRDHDRINEGSLRIYESLNGVEFYGSANLTSVQLTIDHSTNVEEEVQRIKNEHEDDSSAVMNDRVKGYLKITRAFGAGFLKQPKWNDALLEMFRIDYVGTSPYITCNPSLFHHKLGPTDQFLILSSDGLYQYFTNEEAVAEVESFISSFPEGDPAQHLIEELLFRAARKAGIDFHELLDIPQGERRRYHDDVSVIIISLEGRIWRSFV